MGTPPIFIVGASRSGTTMLRLILNAHSRIAVPDELGYFTMWPVSVAVEGWRAPSLTAEQYERFVRRFLGNCARNLNEIDIEELERKILDAPTRDLRSPYRLTLEAWAEQQGKTRWGEKTPRNLYYVDVIEDMFPEAKFIYLVRDPRAVVYSMNRIQYFSDDTVLNALNWRRAVTVGYRLLKTSIPASRRVAIRYEGLVREPEKHVRELCAFIGEFFEPEMLEFYRDAGKFMHTIRTPSITRPVRKSNATKWKEGLAPAEVGVVESVCKKEMEQFGYQSVGASPTLHEQLNIGVKRTYWRLQEWRNSKQRDFQVHYPMLARTRSRLRKLFNSPIG